MIGNATFHLVGDFRFWRNDPHAQPDTRANPIEIEIASYALLSYAELNAVGDGYNVFRWLLSQRNSYGGFVSTQVLKGTLILAFVFVNDRHCLNGTEQLFVIWCLLIITVRIISLPVKL